MPQKFIKLFEDYEKELKTERSETSHGWTDVRDAIQMRRPFVIITFRTKPSYEEAAGEYLEGVDYIKQTAVLINNSQETRYPSVFFVLDRDRDFKTDILDLYEKYDIKQIIVGDAGFEYSTLYSQDGSSSDFGNEIVSDLDPSVFKGEDYFKVGSTCYRFIDFVG